jgi:hypothetical protein
MKFVIIRYVCSLFIFTQFDSTIILKGMFHDWLDLELMLKLPTSDFGSSKTWSASNGFCAFTQRYWENCTDFGRSFI